MRGHVEIDRVFLSFCVWQVAMKTFEGTFYHWSCQHPEANHRKWSRRWKNDARNPSPSSGLTFFLYCLCREEGCNNSPVWKKYNIYLSENRFKIHILPPTLEQQSPRDYIFGQQALQHIAKSQPLDPRTKRLRRIHDIHGIRRLRKGYCPLP